MSAWLFLLSASALLLVTCYLRRSATVALLKPHLSRGVTVGVKSAVAYMILLWSMTVAPAALVAAVRETSILFAALIGWAFLGESISRPRWIGVVLIVAGLVVARL